MAAAVTTDEIYKRYLDKAITEILRLERGGRGSSGRCARRAADRSPAGDDLPAQVRAAGARAPGGRRLPRPGRPRAQASRCSGSEVDPMEVFGTNCVKFAGADEETLPGLARRELRIVQPKLVVVMGEDALGSSTSAEFPLSRRSRLRWASSSGSPRRSRRWSSPTSTSPSTSSRQRHDFGTPSSPSAPGGPRCRLTSALAALGGVVRGGPAPARLSALADVGSSRSW